eukprot:TRINITY_DN55043_c0_g1_i1.p1 TRINITY_DN55043_c0_g1~~TRINITY_DN55043_c0_g1_i1.p1  ORF type:complete len:308 (+),score=35.68 TRINITY_DN55043_c0_g1_i1:61-984(+)
MSNCFAGSIKGLLHRRRQRRAQDKSEGERLLPHASVLKAASAQREELLFAARAHFKDRMTKLEESWLTDEELGIYVRARKTIAERLEILVPALEWRISNRAVLDECRCPCCERNPKAHDARLFGFDLDGDYVFMNCFALPQEVSPEGVIRHMTCLIEKALREYPARPITYEEDGHPRVRTWTFVFDLHGFGVRYYNPKVTMRLMHLFQLAYRQRVKKMIILDPPIIFKGFWKIVKPFMRPSTIEKVQFSHWQRILPQFEERFGTDFAKELHEEALENRDLEKVASKKWLPFYGPSLHKTHGPPQSIH